TSAPQANWNDKITIMKPVKENLRWWTEELNTWNGQSWIQQPTHMDIYTNASDAGWGIVINDQTWNGTWKSTESAHHIN
ncbi:hypothetical protein BGX27_001134, partial [Mortierella sp. AM989]